MTYLPGCSITVAAACLASSHAVACCVRWAVCVVSGCESNSKAAKGHKVITISIKNEVISTYFSGSPLLF